LTKVKEKVNVPIEKTEGMILKFPKTMRRDFIDDDEIYNRYTTERFLQRVLKARPDSDEADKKLLQLIRTKKLKYAPNSMGFLGADINNLLEIQNKTERKVREIELKKVLHKLGKLDAILKAQEEIKKNVDRVERKVDKLEKRQSQEESWRSGAGAS